MSSHHLLIAGTGRAGTTALVKLLEANGLDAGSDQLGFSQRSNAGLEGRFDPEHSPYVVKNPYFSEDLPTLIAGGMDPSVIDAIIVPIRDLDDAANSRIRVFAEHGIRTPGGLWRNKRPSRQRAVLSDSLYQLLKVASDHRIRVITLSFPEFVNDAGYTWAALSDILPGIERDDFVTRFHELMRPDMVSSLPRPSRSDLVSLDARWMAQNARLRAALLKRRLRG